MAGKRQAFGHLPSCSLARVPFDHLNVPSTPVLTCSSMRIWQDFKELQISSFSSVQTQRYLLMTVDLSDRKASCSLRRFKVLPSSS